MVIPVHDVNPVRRTPIVTYTLLLANVAVFVVSPLAFSWLGGTSAGELCSMQAYLERWGAIPAELMSGRQLGEVVLGGGVERAQGVFCVAGAPTYEKVPFVSALSAMFMHGGWAHLAGNMLYLYVFGNNVEDRLGRVRYLLFYLAAGVGATYGFALANAGSRTTLVGASGAVAGVLGAYLMMFPRARVWSLVPVLFFIPLRLPAWLVLGLWFVLQWLYSAGAGLAAEAEVAYLAHVVGFLLGMLAGAVIGGPPQPPRPPARYAPRYYGYPPGPPAGRWPPR